MTAKRIKLKEKDAIIQSLKSGVTPKIGIQHIQVGRVNEIKALYQDIERIKDGGSAFRLIIGEYGSGKTFFLSVIRAIALERKLVTVNADLSPDRRIHASCGQARNWKWQVLFPMSRQLILPHFQKKNHSSFLAEILYDSPFRENTCA